MACVLGGMVADWAGVAGVPALVSDFYDLVFGEVDR